MEGSTPGRNDEPPQPPPPPAGDAGNGQKRRKRRWGAAAPTPVASAPVPAPALSGPVDSKAKALALKASIAARLAALKQSRASASAPASASAAVSASASATASSAKRPLAAPSSSSLAAADPPVAKRAKHYELDMTVTGPTFGRATERLSKPKPKANPYLAHRSEPQEGGGDAPTAANAAATGVGDSSYVDARLEAAGHDARGRERQRRKELRFVAPGTFVEVAERKRQRAANAVSSGFASGRKAGQYFKQATMGAGSHTTTSSYYGTTEVLDDLEDRGILAPRAELGNVTNDHSSGRSKHQPLRAMPLVVEWWDMELLPSRLRKQVAACEGKALSAATQSEMSVKAPRALGGTTTGGDASAAQASDKAGDLRARCLELASLSHSKTAGLVQHIVPVRPQGEASKKAVEPVLYLTKKEQKRARKRRREQKQRELQDLQAAGLIEAPEPRLTLQNFIRVMGDQAYVDPSQMEQKVMEQVQKRQRAHLERNESKKLSKEQRAEKLKNKIRRDADPAANATGAIHVALFFVKNASHPYHRTKIDLNAQQLDISGGVVECDVPNVACVICEGGPRAIQKYKRLMLVRMKWRGPDGDDDGESEEEEDSSNDHANAEPEVGPDGMPVETKKKARHRFDKENKCELVWTGLSTRRQFKGFVFQHCETSAQVYKVLSSKGVGQYWDQVLAHASGSGDSMHLKLVDDSDDDDENENDNGVETNNNNNNKHGSGGNGADPMEVDA